MQGKIFSCKYVYESEDIPPIESLLAFKDALEVQYQPEQLIMANNGSQIILQSVGKPLPSMKVKISWLGEDKIIHPKIVESDITFKKGVLPIDIFVEFYEKQQNYNQKLSNTPSPNRINTDGFGVVNP